MLEELRVRDLGVIDDQTVVLGPGMTVLTGETGAGKTLIVEAIGLLLGARADPVLVRSAAPEATVEGRFVTDAGAERSGGGEVVLRRVVPARGRARAYVDGAMASATVLGQTGSALVDLHGQHAHQSLLSGAAQRRALDRAAGIDPGPRRDAVALERRLREERDRLGGDRRTRAREADLLRFQLDELDAARLDDPEEDAALAVEEERLGDVGALRAAAVRVHEGIAGDDGAADRISSLVTVLAGHEALTEVRHRLVASVAELRDVADLARRGAEGADEDPGRLAAVSERRHRLAELRRKYGESLVEVMAFRDGARARLDELAAQDQRAGSLDAEVAAALEARQAVELAVGDARRAAAAPLAAAIEGRLRTLALPRARFAIDVGSGAGDEVEWRLAANPGEPLAALRQVASGGELARTMLAVRLALDVDAGHVADRTSRRTLVFDEVDAGIGGEAAVAVGAALAQLGRHHQILVVTHLAQVAACADRHLVVTKGTVADAGADERTVAGVVEVDGEGRLTELARMLSGRPDSETGRRHAAELLATTVIAASDGTTGTTASGRTGRGWGRG